MPPVPLLAGAAAVDITPAQLLEIGGGAFGRAQGTLHPLTASALWIGQGDIAALVVSCDLLALDGALADQLRACCAAAAGVPDRAVILACTHTHGAPSTLSLRAWGEPDRGYCALLADRLAGLAGAAARAAVPASLAAGTAPCTGVAVNRAAACGGAVDATLGLVRVVDGGGATIALLVNHAVHPVNLHGCGRYTPDFVHHLRVRLRAQAGAAPVLYLNGACGDLVPASFVAQRPDEAAADATAARIADGVAALLPRLRPLAPRLALAGACAELPLQPLPDPAEMHAMRADYAARLAARYADAQPRDWTWAGWTARVAWADAVIAAHAEGGGPARSQVELRALRLGDALLLAVPGEPFSASALAWRAASAPRPLLVATLVDGYAGYFPSPAAYAAGRYEAVAVIRHTGLQPFASDVAARVGQAGLAALAAVAAA